MIPNNQFWRSTGGEVKYIKTSGGVIIRDNDYLINIFNSSDILEVIEKGSGLFNKIQYLIIPGGGGGGTLGGGGGGGLPLTGYYSPDIGFYPAIVGAGGAGASLATVGLNDGNNSSIFGMTAYYGGGGGSNPNTASKGRDGGNGGGGAYIFSFNNLDLGGVSLYGGYNGGHGYGLPNYNGGGGAGASSDGQDAIGGKGGDGGMGITSLMTGTLERFCDGGGGSSYNSGTPGLKGGSTGGDGGNGDISPTSGLINSGGGGGAGGYKDGVGYFNGANGGSGKIILRYYNPII